MQIRPTTPCPCLLFDCEQAVLRSLGVVAFLRKFYGIEVEQTFSGATGSDRCEP